MNRRALISALRRAVGGGAKRAERAPRPSVASDVPMDTASRVSRGREAGFDMDTAYYHGRGRDLSGDAPRAAPGLWGSGVYVSKSPAEANRYAAMGQRTATDGASGPNVMKLHARGRIASTAERDALHQEMMARGMDDSAALDGALKELQRRGFAGVEDDALGYTLMFDPKDLRSAHAAFDPRRTNERDVLAGVGGLGAAGMGGAYRDEFDR